MPLTLEITRRPDIRETFQPAGNHAYYASYLRPPQNVRDNWSLLLELRVYLRQCNQADTPSGDGVLADYDGNEFQVHDWSETDWIDYTCSYRYLCQRFWDNKFWLGTPDSYAELDWPRGRPTHRPNVWCDFRLELLEQAAHAHYQVEVWQIGEPIGHSHSFRSHSGMYDQRDIQVGQGVLRRRQVAVVHEVGHLLGLRHSAESDHRCVDHNEYCYGGSPDQLEDGRTWWQGRNVMGQAMMLHPSNALPWQMRMVKHTNLATEPEDWEPAFRRAGDPASNPRPLDSFTAGAIASLLHSI